MTNSFKRMPREGSNAMAHPGFATSPYRIFRRQSLSFGVMAAYLFAQQDVSDRIMHGNIKNLYDFLDCCQVKFDLSSKVATMFGGGGLLH